MERKIYVCSDIDSWVNAFLSKGETLLPLEIDFDFTLIHDHQHAVGDFVCFLVGYSRVVPFDSLGKKRFFVIHESDLPAGRGWSPVSWQILSNKQEIVVSLIEAAEKVDSGDIVLQDKMTFMGHELVDEIRLEQITASIRLISRFLKLSGAGKANARPQLGIATYYPRRTKSSSEIDPLKTIEENFDLLRIVDNKRYPAHFSLRGYRYILRIEKG